jgi:hypothetical protein
MSWKKFLLIATIAGAFAFASVPKSEAGVHVGIGIGFPIGYSYGYPYYPYGYPYGYAPYYASYGYYPVVYRRPVVFSRSVVAFRNGRRVVRHHHPR